MRVVSLVAIAAVVLPGWSAAQPRYPQALLAHVRELAGVCRDAGGKAGQSPNLVTVADLNGDGAMDYAVYVGGFNCEGAASALESGQSGSGLAVFVGGPGGTARRAYDDVVYDVRLDKPTNRLVVSVAGESCGQRNAARVPFSEIRACERPLVWNPQKQTFVYGPIKPFK